MSPDSNKESELRNSQEESIYGENIIMQFEQIPTANSKTVHLGSKGKNFMLI